MIYLLDTHILLWLSIDIGFTELSIDGAHAGEVASLPMPHWTRSTASRSRKRESRVWFS